MASTGCMSQVGARLGMRTAAAKSSLRRGASASRLVASRARGAVAVATPRPQEPRSTRSSSSVVTHAVSTELASLPMPPRVVPATLPKVYVYDHCPFCVRVRVGLGMKNVKHELFFMANDDKETPTGLLGKKIAPILVLPDEDKVMGESLDIIELFDADEKYGPTGSIKPATGRTDFKAWQKKYQSLFRNLTRPRYMCTALPEFMQQDSKDFFVSGHQLPPFEKKEWKEGDMSMEKKWEMYTAALDQPELIPELNTALEELDALVFSAEMCSEGGWSYDDVDLWSRLRSLTLVKDAVWPAKLRAYMDNLAKACDVPLYDGMAM